MTGSHITDSKLDQRSFRESSTINRAVQESTTAGSVNSGSIGCDGETKRVSRVRKQQ